MDFGELRGRNCYARTREGCERETKTSRQRGQSLDVEGRAEVGGEGREWGSERGRETGVAVQQDSSSSSIMVRGKAQYFLCVAHGQSPSSVWLPYFGGYAHAQSARDKM